MKTAIYAGSFDPFTYGHLDIIKDSINIFDKVIVAIAHNPDKQAFLPVETRVNLIKECTANIQNIEVMSFEGLTIDFAKKHNAMTLIRGLRNALDFEYENQLAQINSQLDNNIKTVFFIAKPEHSFISSSCVKELVSHKCDISKYVPETICKFLTTKCYS